MYSFDELHAQLTAQPLGPPREFCWAALRQLSARHSRHSTDLSQLLTELSRIELSEPAAAGLQLLVEAYVREQR